MNSKDEYKYRGIKIIFTIISVMLMVPLIKDGGQSFYKTLFIFMIGKVIDLLFNDESKDFIFFAVWDIINQYLGILTCAFSFSALMPDFISLLSDKASLAINYSLTVSVVSFLFKDIAIQVYLTIKVKLVKRDILECLDKL